MFKQIKGALLGGHFHYYIIKEYFIKICWDQEWIEKEFFKPVNKSEVIVKADVLR